MKEKEIKLSTDEIRYLLQGTIHWQDIQEKEKLGVRSSAIPRNQGESVLKKTGETRAIEIENREEKSSPEMETNERSELNHILLGDKVGTSTRNLEGKSVVFLLGTVGFLTVSIWAYFVFAG
jgi:hypothetical protein